MLLSRRCYMRQSLKSQLLCQILDWGHEDKDKPQIWDQTHTIEVTDLAAGIPNPSELPRPQD